MALRSGLRDENYVVEKLNRNGLGSGFTHGFRFQFSEACKKNERILPREILNMSKVSPILNPRRVRKCWMATVLIRQRKEPLRFTFVAIIMLFAASHWSMSISQDSAILSCETSDDPETVAVCLKAKGIEPIFHRLPKPTSMDDSWKRPLYARLDRIRLG